MARPSIAGLKHSDELSLLVYTSGLGPSFSLLLQRLAEQTINLPFLFAPPTGPSPTRAFLALKPDDAPRALEIARDLAGQYHNPDPELISGVCAVNFYPLSRDPALTATALEGLCAQGLKPLAIGTSLSAVVMLVRHAELPVCLDALCSVMELPPGVSPAHVQVSVVQSPLLKEED